MKTIDLNCDMGESYGAWKMGADAEVMPYITSANIACGFHAGDPATIRKTVRLAVDRGVAIGAHPSLPDLMGFGRRVMRISPQDMYDLVIYQAGAVEAFARAAGAKLHHVKCHGALYNMAANDEGLSEAMIRAVKDLGSNVMLYALSESRNFRLAKKAEVPVAGEVFADRGILTAVPALEWNHALFELNQAGRRAEPGSLAQALQELGELLAKHKPATGENPNELPDMPRFELK